MYFKLILTVLFVQLFASVAFGSVAVALNTENKDHPGKCWDDEHKQAIEINKGWQPANECIKYNCGDDFTLDIIGCGKILVGEGQHLEEDLSKSHPECCPRLVLD